MKYLKSYKLFESDNNLDIIANQFISDMAKIYDLRFGKPFDKNKANCAWFTIQFYNWAKSKGIDVKVVYFDSDVEAHIAPLLNGKVFDFAVKQFTRNSNDNYLILRPEDYQKYGYQSFEIYDDLPELETVFPADKVNEGAEHLLLKSFGQPMYGIYDWIEDLKSWEWSRTQHIDVNADSIKKWSDRFIGQGWYDKVKNLVDKMFVALEKVDEEEIHMRMYDVYDQIPSSKDKWTMCCIAYGDVENYNKPNRYKYNGLITVRNKDDRDKMRIIIHILKEIVFPTLKIGSYPDMMLRQSDESYYVTAPKWQCQNFNIDDYQEMGIKAGTEFEADDYKDRKTRIFQHDIDRKKSYSIDKILEMYKPAVIIEIGNRDNSISTGGMNLKNLESLIDESLESILPTLDYEEVIYDMSRGNRQFDENSDVYDYTVKILLNF
jgi:hypothetical protein